FEAASEAGLSLVAAGLPRREAMALARGTKELEADVQARHALGSPLPEPLSSSLNQDLVASHCGYLTEETVAPMARVQRARDARMADAMLAAEGPAVLIAGGEHARPDRGVPWYIRRHSPEVTLAVRFIEVDAEKPKPTDYAERNSGGFDIFVFTPRLRDIDYCAELKAKGF
ncbi:MAG: ChaN family lipoprotein, partial [Myxococcota bacterium]